MAIINQALVDGAHAVARAVELHVRQTASSALSSAITASLSSATDAPSPTSSVTSFASPTSTTLSDPTTTANSGSQQQSNNNGTSSPLLFFVALGFGVVFTNLWIIVGVKYCFRYNARNRQLRGLDENGEPINLENMPTRPHRRRREKKLMTMDEVNDKFPMMKYKSWVADRAKDGLPTAGGVSVPPSRANSIRSVQGIVPETASKERDSTDDRPKTCITAKSLDDTANPDVTSGSAEYNAHLTQAKTTDTAATKDLDRAHTSDDEDDDERINAALPPELLVTSGDTCAICIDTLEDDDDVRGLTCGHAFHAVCLDPWLTNRRACCPLCKADYYTPKPRPPLADTDLTSSTSPHAVDPSRNNGRLNLPRSPQSTFSGWNLRGPARVAMGGRPAGQAASNDPHQRRQGRAWERRRREPAPVILATPAQGEQQPGLLTRIRGHFPLFTMNDTSNRNRRGAQNDAPEVASSGANNAITTPSVLEAGTGRPSTNVIT